MNNLYIPHINPVRFNEVNPVEVDQYLTRHYQDYPFLETRQPWEEMVGYYQKYQTSDTVYLQFTSNFDPLSFTVIDCNYRVYLSQNAIQKRVNKYVPGYFIYELSISWASFNTGVYFIQMTAGDTAMISEPILISETCENSLFLEYRNSRFHSDVIFETGIRFGFRVEGTIGRLLPGSSDVIYNDQKYNPTVLSSRTYNNFKLSIGGETGVPDWVVEKINLIFSCNDVWIDGKSYAKVEGKFEFAEEAGLPMRAINMEIREGNNRGSKVISPTVDTNRKLVIGGNITSRLFGDLSQDASSNVIIIETFG